MGITHKKRIPGKNGWLATRDIFFATLIFLVAYYLRRLYFSGFILGDDIEEIQIIRIILDRGPDFQGHVQYRFGLWIFNLLAFKLLGVSEFSFFLPTWLMSSSLSVIGYALLRLKGYPVFPACMAGLFVATAPYEILIGTVRANDLILAWVLAMGLFFFIVFEKKPVLQGICTAFFLWFGFYVKLWDVYLLPALGIYYLICIFKKKKWQGLAGFAIASLILHGITAMLWKAKIGYFLPFLHHYSATYPVAAKDLFSLFKVYPSMIFKGSEFGATLFGTVPYLLLAGLFAKSILTLTKPRIYEHYRFDSFDIGLISYYGTFFLFLNFFPNSFVFDQYYSAPRIFRYLAPISFVMTLHVAKMLIDLSNFSVRRFHMQKVAPLLLGVAIVINYIQADAATKPGQIYRENLMAVLEDVKKETPPILLSEAWLSFFLRELYLKAESQKTIVTPIWQTFNAREYEKWLIENQTRLPVGTMLLTGLGSFVHYGGHYDGFRLKQFHRPLHPAWSLYKSYGKLSYLPVPESAKLWRLTRKIEQDNLKERVKNDPSASDNGPDSLFNAGMILFEEHKYSDARLYFQKVVERFPTADRAPDALYFSAICYFRESNWKDTINEFTRLKKIFPQSVWEVGAHYHIGLSHSAMGNQKLARQSFEYVISRFPEDTNMVSLAKGQLKRGF